MTSILMVMNARDITECILSLKALRIDKVWFRGYTEKQLETEITDFVESTNYDYYILVSDDVIATQFALDNLLKFQTASEVVTGWCNIFPGRTISNLELKPQIEGRQSLYIRVRDHMPKSWVRWIKAMYRLPLLHNVIDWPIYNHFPDQEKIWAQEPLFRTYFVGWALTSICRATWLKYGFRYPTSQKAGHGSDRAMSTDLLNDNVVALCARDSFVYHLGTVRNFIVGKVKPEVIFEPMQEARH